MGKQELKAWFDQGRIVPFDPGKPGHTATNYSRWFGPEGRQAYPVQYELRYEPWVMCDRRNVPWHDHLFKGYGLNKIVHLEHMNSIGYRWEEREGMALNGGKESPGVTEHAMAR